MSKTLPIRILIVDDEVDHADVMAEAVARMGHSVKTAHNLADAKRYFAEDDFDLVITDLRMDAPGDGFELLRFVRQSPGNKAEAGGIAGGAEVIVVTAHGDVSTAVQAMREGAYDFIQKPLDLEVIRAQVRRAAEKILLARKNQDLSQALDQRFGIQGIIGNSAPMQRVLQLVRQIAPTDINVLILGESGTGKELVARALHQNSRRREERFVALNCAGMNEGTLEDELFGHIRGAFTDARGDRAGRFEYADGGTLFLDEIGDMPLPMQAKLLRVLQDKQITRLGSNEPIQVDVRFIAATNKDLELAVREKTFRDDLYFRIKGATIQIPPLRARREDIPLLINHVLERSESKLGRKVEGIEAAARNALIAYPWPGNVRQLENVVENMIVLTTGPKLTMADLPPEIAPMPLTAGGYTVIDSTAVPLLGGALGSNEGDGGGQNLLPASTQALATIPQMPFGGNAIVSLAGVNLAELEKKAIEETLASVQGNRELAAKILGIGERTLYRKIKEYGLKE